MAGKRLTADEINLRLQDRGIMIVGEYKTQRVPTLFRCSEGHEWEAAPHSILHKKQGCGKCGGNTRLTQKEVSEYLETQELKLITEYKNAKEHITVVCKNNHKWSTNISNIKCGKSCPECQKIWANGGYVYIMSGNTGTKIGISNNVNVRLREVRQASQDETISLVFSYPFSGRAAALQVEKQAHEELKEYSLTLHKFTGSTEFFSVSPEFADATIRKFYGHKRQI